MVRGCVVVTGGARCHRHGTQRFPRRPTSLRGPTQQMDRNLLDLRNRPSHSAIRRGLGGARLERLAVSRLQRGRSALVAALILAVLIAGWHLPLMVAGQVHYSDIVAAVIVFNWV